MGKHKSARGRSNRHAPASVPQTSSTAPASGASDAMEAAMSGAASFGAGKKGDDKDIRLIQMVELLACDAADQRVVACGTLAMLFTAEANVKYACEKGIDAMLINALHSDASVAVRADAAGAIRNLVSTGASKEHVSVLVQKGILPACVAALGATFKTANEHILAPQKKSAEAGAQGGNLLASSWALVEQVAKLLTNCCELHDDVTDVINGTAASLLLLKLLGLRGASPQMAVAVLSLLQLLAEDNGKLVSIIQGSEETMTLVLGMLTYDRASLGINALVQTAAAAFALIVRPDDTSTETLATITSGLLRVVATPTAPLFAEVAPKLSVLQGGSADAMQWDVARDLNHLLEAQVDALETLANLCFVGAGDGGDDDGWEDVDDDAGMAPAMADDPTACPHMDEVLQRVLVEQQAVAHVKDQCVPLDKALEQVFAAGKSADDIGLELLTTKRMVHQRALGCLSNMFTGMHGDAFDAAIMSALWLTLLDLASQVPHGTDNEFLDVLTSTAFALLRTIVAKSGEGDPSPEGTKVVLLVPTADQVELMCRITAQASTTAVAINMIGCLGCIGQLNAPITHCQRIGEVLVQALQSPDPGILAETLNSIFDVFAETTYNSVVQALNLVPALKTLIGQLKQIIRQSKATCEPEILGRLHEARINLKRFLEYKASQ
eukprot:m.54413 g.54413  ORF g.54413 m.54413 type:complete len:667 (+) comp15510_c0_seq2:221-2221(+)